MAKKIKQQEPAQQPFRDYCDTWLVTQKKFSLRNSSYDVLESTFFLYIYPSIGDLRMEVVTTSDLQNLLNTRAETLSLNSLKKIYSALREVFYYAFTIQDLHTNPMNDVVFPYYKYSTNQGSKIVVLTEEEQIRLYKICLKRRKNKKLSFRLGPAVILLLATGMRSGELLSLKCSNIDLERKEIFIDSTVSRIKNRDEKDDTCYCYEIHSTKTKAGTRVIPLNEWAIKAIRLLQEEVFVENDMNFLFTTKQGKIYKHRMLARDFDRLLTLANIEHRTLHCLRHTFATQILRENKNMIILSSILGHTTPTTTYNTYIHLLDEEKETAIQLLDD